MCKPYGHHTQKVRLKGREIQLFVAQWPFELGCFRDMGSPSAEGKEGVAESIEVLHGDFGLLHESIECHCPALGPATHSAGQMARRQSGMSSGQHKIAEGLKGRFHLVNPVFELRDVVHSDRFADRVH